MVANVLHNTVRMGHHAAEAAPKSLNESLAILRLYRDNVSDLAYKKTEEQIRGGAIEDIFYDDFDIRMCLIVYANLLTDDEAALLVNNKVSQLIKTSNNGLSKVA
ncbi:hypothetical protein FACS189487_10350 [Campylobacterota bacterium]|nr:hypothetical protein FACS189487_10350 [Campylobacterota bacterium]